jgi:hypothetical protein
VAISSNFDLNITMGIIIKKALEQLQADAVDILQFNPHTHVLEYMTGQGFRSRAITRSRLWIGEGHTGRAALERKMVSIPDLPSLGNGFQRSELLAGEEFITYHAVPLVAKGLVKGVLEIFHRRPFMAYPEWNSFLEILAGQATIAIDNSEMFQNLQRSNLELALAYDATIEGWSRALDMRDHEPEGHARRVSDMTLRLARAMGVNDHELVHYRRGALLHDIGKMSVPDSILFKNGPLDDSEWEIMRMHPQHAFELLSQVNYLRSALDIPYCHHEKYDGSGYPRQLSGNKIPLAARIFAVVDVWDSLKSERAYRSAWETERVIEYLRAETGRHFDPRIVETFLRIYESGDFE